MCNILVNNSLIVNVRAKPMVTMLEDIRMYIVERWQTNILKVSSFEGSIYPKIGNIL